MRSFGIASGGPSDGSDPGADVRNWRKLLQIVNYVDDLMISKMVSTEALHWPWCEALRAATDVPWIIRRVRTS